MYPKPFLPVKSHLRPNGGQGPKKYFSACKRAIIQWKLPAAKYLFLRRADDQTDELGRIG